MAMSPLDGLCLDGLAADTWSEVLEAMARAAVEHGHARDTFPAALAERERNYPTGLPTEVPTAIPHSDPEHVLTTGIGIARLAEPVAFGEMGGSGETVNVQVVVMLLVKPDDGHMAALTAVLDRVQDNEAMTSLLAAEGDQDLQRRAALVFGG